MREIVPPPPAIERNDQAAIQELYPRATVTVEIEKLAPPCPGVPASCGVRLRLPARA